MAGWALLTCPRHVGRKRFAYGRPPSFAYSNSKANTCMIAKTCVSSHCYLFIVRFSILFVSQSIPPGGYLGLLTTGYHTAWPSVVRKRIFAAGFAACGCKARSKSRCKPPGKNGNLSLEDSFPMSALSCPHFTVSLSSPNNGGALYRRVGVSDSLIGEPESFIVPAVGCSHSHTRPRA